MKSGNYEDPSPEQYRSTGEYEPEIGKRRFLHSPLRIVTEIASVVVILFIAIYFILGASAKSPTPTSSTVFNSTATSPTGVIPSPTGTQASNLPTNLPKMQVLSVVPDNSTVKISFKPVAGAKDYRIFDVSEPTVVKYAGMAHLTGGPFRMNADGTPVYPFQTGGNGPGTLNIPYPQIEWNLLEDEQPHTLVVQAVNELGPIPPGNLYNNNNAPINASSSKYYSIGMNEGATPDGHVSVNGQGPSTNNPKPIAQSIQFVVQANANYRAIPSSSSATQTFFDTFNDSEASAFKKVSSDAEAETATYTLNAGTSKAWTIEYQDTDVRDSYPFISGGHFMDVLFDGGTPGTNNPLHIAHGAMTMTPNQTVDFSGGNVLHITMEVDLHMDTRRWIGVELTPANDPLTGFDPFTGAINTSDQALFFDFYPGTCTADIFTGPSGGAGPSGSHFWGALGQSDNVCDTSEVNWGGNGIPLDNRSKVDLFISQTHAALVINGQLAMQSNIPGGLPFSQAKVYFSHYLYHTGNDINELSQSMPWETFWINYYHWSDERHWDNMGFEVLPASVASNDTAWEKLSAMPGSVAPTPALSGPGVNANKNAPASHPQGSTVMVDTPKRVLS